MTHEEMRWRDSAESSSMLSEQCLIELIAVCDVMIQAEYCPGQDREKTEHDWDSAE